MTTESELSPQTAWVITIIAIIAAAAPHAFFAPPLQLHMEGQFQSWLGIAVWAPAILAGVGFFFGVEFGNRDARRESVAPSTRASMLVVGFIAAIVFTAMLHVDRWADVGSMRPWEHLKTALPLFAGLGVLRAIFFQGFVQHRVLHSTSAVTRVATLCALELVIAAPFLASGDTRAVATGLLPLVLTDALLGAATHELGYPVRISMLVRGLFGLSFVWFQQIVLL